MCCHVVRYMQHNSTCRVYDMEIYLSIYYLIGSNVPISKFYIIRFIQIFKTTLARVKQDSFGRSLGPAICRTFFSIPVRPLTDLDKRHAVDEKEQCKFAGKLRDLAERLWITRLTLCLVSWVLMSRKLRYECGWVHYELRMTCECDNWLKLYERHSIHLACDVSLGKVAYESHWSLPNQCLVISI